MLLGVIADDFTGASDIANTLTKGIAGQGGLRTTQFLGVPKQPALPDVDAGVIRSRAEPLRHTRPSHNPSKPCPGCRRRDASNSYSNIAQRSI